MLLLHHAVRQFNQQNVARLQSYVAMNKSDLAEHLVETYRWSQAKDAGVVYVARDKQDWRIMLSIIPEVTVGYREYKIAPGIGLKVGACHAAPMHDEVAERVLDLLQLQRRSF